MASADLFKKIQRIHILTTHLATDILAGAYRSAFKGRGMEFEEVRDYQSGDDVRSIDWNVTARMGHLYVKNFREERELNVTLAVDISSSTRFGSQGALKSDLIAEIAAVLAFSAIKNNDKIALILFSDRVEKYLPPKSGSRHVLRIVRELLTYRPEGSGTDVGAALSFLGHVQHRSGICFLLSDFICGDYSHEAAVIAQKHDLVPIVLVDPAEENMPALGLVPFVDLEEGGLRWTDTSAGGLREHLTGAVQERLNHQQKLMRRLGKELCILDTARPYIPQLRGYFARRQQCGSSLP